MGVLCALYVAYIYVANAIVYIEKQTDPWKEIVSLDIWDDQCYSFFGRYILEDKTCFKIMTFGSTHLVLLDINFILM